MGLNPYWELRVITRNIVSKDVWAELYKLWEAQQEVYIPARERRYDVLFEVLEAHGFSGGNIVDLACGPGSLSRRCLERFPNSQVTAVDIDPLLVAIGEGAALGEGDKIRWIRGDLRETQWIEALGDTKVDVFVSSTALHWLTEDELEIVFRAARKMLAPGGILLNADYFEPTNVAEKIRRLVGSVENKREELAVGAGALSWDAWWARVGEIRAFDGLLKAREEIFADRDQTAPSPTEDQQIQAAHRAGFSEAQVVWQDLNEFLLVAL